MPIFGKDVRDFARSVAVRYRDVIKPHLFLPEIVKFREMIEQRLERHEPPLPAIPDEHKPVIAKLAHERYVPTVLI
jgi:hypothetical protein